jgi:uncharacterized membrane protein SpoIIM required for sporulation
LQPNSNNRDADAWLRARASRWQRLAAEAQSAPHRSRASSEEALRTMESYRTLARDLASARELLPGNIATVGLESAYTTLHAAVNRSPRFGRARLATLFRNDIPAAAASVRTLTLWIALLLMASALAGWWLISTYPELVGLIASEKMIDGVEHGHLWTDDLFNIVPSSVLSARIMSNNVVVTCAAFCAGLFLGLGTFYMISLNGLMLGGLLAFAHQHGLGLALLRFILAHGPVELSVICLAGAAGTALGESLIRPVAPTRAESFRRTAAHLGPLLVACALLLIGSGLIEGFISPDPHISIAMRILIGLGYWSLMILMLSGKLRPGGAHPMTNYAS